ncbi:unnamed protein product [Adineta steineri]|uniref:Uncharacterized protein n=1 Tax=Adineta steineri TaxID=433720 RepID=A0A816G2H3_9BILA|nr:unnamed protein product [Adineta steineri]CAF1668500.1 unnamed protein product [Adineta steineri]
MSQHNNTVGLKTQESNDLIDRYITGNSLRVIPEQIDLVQYSKSLPSYLPRMLSSHNRAQFFQAIIQLVAQSENHE